MLNKRPDWLTVGQRVRHKTTNEEYVIVSFCIMGDYRGDWWVATVEHPSICGYNESFEVYYLEPV